MPDVRQLLREAAGEPSGRLDLAAVERRVQQLRRDRWLQLASAAVAVVAVAAAVMLIRSGEGRTQELHVVTPTPATTTASPAQRSDAAPVQAPPREPTAVPPAAASAAPAAPAAHGTKQLPSASTSPAPSRGYPAADGCAVESTPTAPTASCRFTATVSAGWLFSERGGASVTSPSVSFVVKITHDGTTTTHRYGESRCGTAEIQPGDEVSLAISQSSTVGDYSFYDLKAGPDRHC